MLYLADNPIMSIPNLFRHTWSENLKTDTGPKLSDLFIFAEIHFKVFFSQRISVSKSNWCADLDTNQASYRVGVVAPSTPGARFTKYLTTNLGKTLDKV